MSEKIVALEAEYQVCLKVGKSAITLSKDGTVEIKGERFVFNGQELSITTTSKCKIESQDVTVQGTNFSVKSYNQINLSASGILEIKGTLVKLN